MRDYFERGSNLHFVFPIDGDCLNEYDGEVEDGTLIIEFKLASDCPVTINGVEAELKGKYYTAEIGLEPGKNLITADNGRQKKQISVFRLKSAGLYRLSSDDNIIFLWDINKNADRYNSIFDNPYLNLYRKAHELYGASVHLNIYYELQEDHPDFTDKREYFNLSMMTDKFRDEWEANSDWLKLNFHAKSDKPDNPYIDTDYNTIYEDCKKVQNEIIRFAGQKTLSDETTIHWGQCTEEGIRALRDLGIKYLAGYFTIRNGNPIVSYFYPNDLVSHLEARDFWYDCVYDMFYCKIDCVLNSHEEPEISPLLNGLSEEKTRSGFLELMIHEQYFYNDYIRYIPDFEDIVLTACKWARQNGYQGSFICNALSQY